MKKTFAELFKKYRLRAEFEKLSELGNALAEKGVIYEDSLFSHWQKGNRVPHNRIIVLSLIHIFIERKAIVSLEEANEFFASSDQGYLTDEEIMTLPHTVTHATPFQIPREIAHFTGREALLQTVTNHVSHSGVFLFHGPSGVGKTAFAIHVGLTLRTAFPDGILWYRVDTTSPMDILLSIAQTFHENISGIQDIEVRASIVRSLLANKKILLIFDNVEEDTNIRVLLPNSSSSVILTSKHKTLTLDSSYEAFSLTSFTREELVALFTKILSTEYVAKHQDSILDLGNKVGNLPLALNIYAKQLAFTKQSPQSLLHAINTTKTTLKALSYEDKNLYTSIDISFQSLDEKTKKIFLSLGVFEGKDFSVEAVAAINNLKKPLTLQILLQLLHASLLEESSKQRYRLHPLIKRYIKNTKIDQRVYTAAANYFAEFLEKNKQKDTVFYNTHIIDYEIENIIHIFEACFNLNQFAVILKIWKNLGLFFLQTGKWQEIIFYGEKVYNITKNNKYVDFHVRFSIYILCWVYYFMGDLKRVSVLTNEGLEISNILKNDYLIALNRQRLGKLYKFNSRSDESIQLSIESLPIFKKYKDMPELLFTYKNIGEVYCAKRDYKKSIHFLEKALKIAKKTKDYLLIVIFQSVLSQVFYLDQQYRKAKKMIYLSLRLDKNYNIMFGALRVFNYLVISLISNELHQIQIAKKYFSLAQKENQFLKLKKESTAIYFVTSDFSNKLKEAGFYIFE